MDAKITISTPRDYDREYVSISIKDSSSGINILEMEILHSEFSRAITGLAFCKAEISGLVNEDDFYKIGKLSESRYLDLIVPETQYKLTKEQIKEEFDYLELAADGWEIKSNGINEKQNKEGIHTIILVRYI